MMAVSRADAMDMSLWEYESRLHHWNEAHSADDVAPPHPELAQRLVDAANADPRMTH